jgi:serine/threonine-protein kinase
MATTTADRNLLFGLLALQIGLINQGQLVAAFQAWTLDKAKAMADHLVGRGDLDADDRSAVEALVARHIKKHGDVGQSLAAIPAGRSTRESLARVRDADVEASLAQLCPASTQPGSDADRTATYAVGTATSDGQRFRILRPHAQGGLGAVFVALDGELHREVALKQILDQHADDPVSRARFLLEAEITGGLEHPGIVPVYGLGTYSGGRPYYAMRFVKGDSLKDAIERYHGDASLRKDSGRRSLELRKLLRRFTDVCNAVEYAHSRGVLHRDIKPGNVIVGRHGETLVVDWGLAKLIGKEEPGSVSEERVLVPSSTSGSAETLPGSALGTPAYMSPEQAAGRLDLLGSASDIYGLGATLFCVLTGRAPFESLDVGTLLQRVQKGEFPRPRRLNPSVPRALEAICLKAMAQRPEDRYSSPRALADDVERWMADEPVTAYREPWTTHARRWVSRHRTAVVAATSALVVAVAGLATLIVFQQRANEDLRAALNRESEATSRATARLGMASQAIDAFYTGVSGDMMLGRPEFRDLGAKLLRTALDFYLRMQADMEADPLVATESARAVLAASYERVGEIQSTIGAKEDALKAYTRAVALYEPPAYQGTRIFPAKILVKIARLHRQMGHADQALAAFGQAVADFEAVAAYIPSRKGDLAWALLNLGALLAELGRSTEAMRVLERSVAVGEETARAEPHSYYVRQDVAASYNVLGNLHNSFGRADEAIRCHEQACAIMERLVAEAPTYKDHDEHMADLARAYNNLGYDLTDLGRQAQALETLERGRRIRLALYAAQPANTGWRSDTARSHYHLARLRVWNGPAAEAQRELRKSEELLDGLPVLVPEDLYVRACVAALHLPLIGSGSIRPTAEEQAERRKYADQALGALRRAVAGGFRNIPLFKNDRALDPLRALPDFQALMMDVGFPSDSFAPDRDAHP